MVIHRFYIEHVHLQSISVILQFPTYLKNTGKKFCKIKYLFYSEDISPPPLRRIPIKQRCTNKAGESRSSLEGKSNEPAGSTHP